MYFEKKTNFIGEIFMLFPLFERLKSINRRLYFNCQSHANREVTIDARHCSIFLPEFK